MRLSVCPSCCAVLYPFSCFDLLRNAGRRKVVSVEDAFSATVLDLRYAACRHKKVVFNFTSIKVLGFFFMFFFPVLSHFY